MNTRKQYSKRVRHRNVAQLGFQSKFNQGEQGVGGAIDQLHILQMTGALSVALSVTPSFC